MKAVTGVYVYRDYLCRYYDIYPMSLVVFITQ